MRLGPGRRTLRLGLLVGLLTGGFVGASLVPSVATAPPVLRSGTSPTLPTAPPRLPAVAPPLEEPFEVADGVARRTVAYGGAGLQQSFDVFTPASRGKRPRPTVLLIHGGSWQLGDSTEWEAEAVELVQSRGWTAVALNYRLAPEAVWPAQLRDGRAALDLLRSRADELSVDVDRIGAIGDSAGGHLAALLGEPSPGRAPLRAVVTWSGVNDLAGITAQPSSGGCPAVAGCAYRGLAAKVVRDLMDGCTPVTCPDEYALASPAAGVGPEHAATLAFGSETEQIDPRQAWVMDAALHRNQVSSRVHVLPGDVHGRGYQDRAWQASLSFLAATLTPETSPEYPRPAIRVSLDLPERSTAAVGRPVRLTGAVRPRQAGSSVRLQVRQPDGSWRTARHVPLRTGPDDTSYELSWTPLSRGSTVWRAVWQGGGATGASDPRVVEVR